MNEAHICCVAVAPLRAEPRDPAEMTSQILFGEFCRVLEKKDQWRKVRLEADGYEGWTDEKLLHPIPDSAIGPARWFQGAFSLMGTLRNLKTGTSYNIQLPMGVTLPASADFSPSRDGNHSWQAGDLRLEWHRGGFIRAGAIKRGDLLASFAGNYLGAPYLWGGRTPWGIDCSGFTQAVLKTAGIQVRRDAWMQAEEGKEVAFADRKDGDVAFFRTKSDRITHVGILMGTEILHAHGRVRRDLFTEEGIINQESKQLTHVLIIIKRYF